MQDNDSLLRNLIGCAGFSFRFVQIEIGLTLLSIAL